MTSGPSSAAGRRGAAWRTAHFPLAPRGRHAICGDDSKKRQNGSFFRLVLSRGLFLTSVSVICRARQTKKERFARLLAVYSEITLRSSEFSTRQFSLLSCGKHSIVIGLVLSGALVWCVITSSDCLPVVVAAAAGFSAATRTATPLIFYFCAPVARDYE